ncbi:T9SS type A sorting domain-containing protein [Flavobacterium hauense]
MKKQLLTGAFLMGAFFTMNAQQTLFQDSFDTYSAFTISGIGNWTQIDIDGAPTYTIEDTEFENAGYTGTGIVFDPTATTPALAEAWAPRTGINSLNFFAAVTQNLDDPTAVGPNNDWFVSPQISLAESGNKVTFYAKSITAQYGLERMALAISTTGNTDPADFTVLTQGTYVQVPIEWTEYTINLDQYAGQDVYIAIHYLTDDAFALLVDDFSVTADGTAGLNENLASKLSVYPNPANNVVTIDNNQNIQISAISIVDINGRTVKSAQYDGVSNAQINISELSSGIYMMNIASDQGMTTKKIVKN